MARAADIPFTILGKTALCAHDAALPDTWEMAKGSGGFGIRNSGFGIRDSTVGIRDSGLARAADMPWTILGAIALGTSHDVLPDTWEVLEG